MERGFYSNFPLGLRRCCCRTTCTPRGSCRRARLWHFTLYTWFFGAIGKLQLSFITCEGNRDQDIKRSECKEEKVLNLDRWEWKGKRQGPNGWSPWGVCRVVHVWFWGWEPKIPKDFGTPYYWSDSYHYLEEQSKCLTHIEHFLWARHCIENSHLLCLFTPYKSPIRLIYFTDKQ